MRYALLGITEVTPRRSGLRRLASPFRLVLALVIGGSLAGCGSGAHKSGGPPPFTTAPHAHPKALSFTQLVAKVKTGV